MLISIWYNKIARRILKTLS